MKNQIKEIIWQIVNSFLAAALVFLGGLSAGVINETTVMAAGITAGVIFLSKFRDYWLSEEEEYIQVRKTKIGAFL